MNVQQFEDKALSHYSYAILEEFRREIIIIDPSREISPYLDHAEKHGAKITGVIETHPHADFVSGHLELHRFTGAVIYCSKLVGALYPHRTFDDGDDIRFGKIKLKCLNTPGHSPDSISVVLEHEGKDKAVFTGDTLFIGDCGRPDLRENAGCLTATREQLSKQLYHSLRDKLSILDNDVVVYPAHGAGTLCGKALSEANTSTIGTEKLSNWSLQYMDEDQFVSELLQDQPFVPKYFPYDVQLNKNGATDLAAAIAKIPRKETGRIQGSLLIIDTRPEAQFKKGHIHGSVNIQGSGKFETWLGSIIAPDEYFYLVAQNEDKLQEVMARCAKIGYELFVIRAFVCGEGEEKMEQLDVEQFKGHPQNYTIVDIRNASEVNDHPFFENTTAIPLPELRERVMEIPRDKPIVVHCAGGYRSAAGSSIVDNAFGEKIKVYDLGEDIKLFL